MQLITSGKREAGSGGESRQDSGNEPVAKMARTIESLQRQVKELKQTRKGGGKGPPKGGRVTAQQDFGRQDPEGASSASASSDAFGRLKQLQATERFKYKLDGPSGKTVCTFWNRGACTRKNCKFSHVCLRCHKAGHTVLECHAPQQTA